MDLVDDDGLDGLEYLGGTRCEHEEEALWRCDEYVGWVPQHRLTFRLWGVTRPHGD